jgi:ubiquinone/menaquinone biosynthesis C-methylase UbiE
LCTAWPSLARRTAESHGADVRLSLRGDSFIERIAVRLGLVPRPAVEAWAGVALSAILATAAQQKLFENLSGRWRSADDLSQELGLDRDVTLMTLSCLQSIGYVERHRDAFRLTHTAKRWLDPASDTSVAHFVASCADYVSWWSHLEDSLKSGATIQHHATAADSAYWPRYISGQRDLARISANEIAKRVPIPRAAVSMLDIGGGHGLYSAAICNRRPQLKSTILDLPGSARAGAQLVAGTAIADRIQFVEGDALETPFGEQHDAVLCFNLIHHFRPQDAATLFAKARLALRPEGVLCVLDAFETEAQTPQPAQAFVSLFMHLSSGARLYSIGEMETLLTEAGFADIRWVRVRRAPGLRLCTATGLSDLGKTRLG